MKFIVPTMIAAYVLCLSPSSALDQSCLKMNAPNVLGIGTCLGTTGDFCSDDASSGITLITNLITCSIQGIASLNVGTQLKLIEQFLVSILNRNGLAVITKALYGACGVVGGAAVTIGDVAGGIARGLSGFLPGGRSIDKIIEEVTGLVDCSGLQIDDTLICDDVITINIPAILDVGTCINGTLETCEEGEALDGALLKGLFDALGCMFTSLGSRISTAVRRTIECLVITQLEKALGSSGFLFKSLIKTLRTKIGCRTS